MPSIGIVARQRECEWLRTGVEEEEEAVVMFGLVGKVARIDPQAVEPKPERPRCRAAPLALAKFRAVGV